MMICSRRLYKGNAYDICLPLADSGVTLARFYTRGDVIVEKEPEISGDSMCFSFTEEDLASLEDGVLRYQVVTDYETTDTNSPYVVVTPGDYSGSTLEDLLEDAYDSGYTDGQEDCTGGTCEGVYESGYTDGYQSGYTDGVESIEELTLRETITDNGDYAYAPLGGLYKNVYLNVNVPQTGHTDQEMQESWNSGYTSGSTDGYQTGYDDGYNAGSESCSGEYDRGYSDGYESGTTDGYQSGYTSGSTAGFQSGYTSGRTDGYNSGYSAGYAAGLAECSPDYSHMNPTIEALEDGNLIVRQACQYSINEGPWTLITATTTLSLHEGDKVQFVDRYEGTEEWGEHEMDGMFSGNTLYSKVYGRMSNLYKEDSIVTLQSMFEDYTGLVDASGLDLEYGDPEWPVDSVPNDGYEYMFKGCTSLVHSPSILPATQLGSYCYMNMFSGCTNLIDAPELPATGLTDFCYSGMFYGCTSLRKAPVLPAPVLTWECYSGMFLGCQLINHIECLAENPEWTDPMTDAGGLGAWLRGVSSTGIFVKKAGVTTWPTGDSGIPTGWTVIEA